MAERLKHKRANAVRNRAMTARLDRVEAQLAVLSKPAADEARRDARFFYRAVSWLERLWLTRLLVLVLGLLAGVTFLGFLDERQARQEERITRAYQTLSSPTAGGTSKTRALTLLHSEGKALTGFDLSGPDDVPVMLEELALTDAWFSNVGLQNVTFHDSALANTGITNSDLRRFRFDGLIWGELRHVEASGSAWNHWGGEVARGKQTIPLTVFASVFDHAALDIQSDRLPAATANPKPSPTRIPSPGVPLAPLGPPTPEVEFQLYDSSLRCGRVTDPRPDAVQFFNVNLSGTRFDFIGPFVAVEAPRTDGPPEVTFSPRRSALYAALAEDPTRARAMFVDSWYFSDNPPTGLPAAALATLQSRDRADFIAACHEGALSSFTATAWHLLDDPSALCASLARTPTSCASGESPSGLAPRVRTNRRYDGRYHLGNADGFGRAGGPGN